MTKQFNIKIGSIINVNFETKYTNVRIPSNLYLMSVDKIYNINVG